LKRLLPFAVAILCLMCAFSACRSSKMELLPESSTMVAIQSTINSQGLTTLGSTSITTWPQSQEHIYTFFPLTTKIKKDIQNSVNGVTIGKTTLEDLKVIFDEKNIEFQYEHNFDSIKPPMVVVGLDHYCFDERNVVCQISIRSLETDTGARTGDNIERIIGLYGDGFQKQLYGEMMYGDGNQWFDGDTIIEYTDGMTYLRFWFGRDNLLNVWAVAKETAMLGVDPDGFLFF